MRGISSLALSVALVFITGFPASARPPGNELMAIPIPPSKQVPGSTTTLPPQVQPSVPIPVKPAVLRDALISQPWWRQKIKSQVSVTQNLEYDACLFGDSISSGIGNTLGASNFNFALGGMSTVSLLPQLKSLAVAKVKCTTAIIAIGTNDAEYTIANDNFVENLKQSIALVKGMGATNIFLIPAFYSTLEASHNPRFAGTIARVEEINALIRQVAAMEKVVLFEEDIQPLYEGQALRKDLTTDGVHLNPEGQKIYRQALLKLLLHSKGCK